MKATSALSAILLLLVHSTSGLRIGFTEVDYRTTEPEGTLRVVLAKDGENAGPLSFTLTPLTYSEYTNLGFALPDSVDLPDAAEFQSSGPQDFIKATQTVNFAPSVNTEFRELSFSVIDDEIHEVTEGFLIVLEVDDTTANPQDLIDLEMAINVTLGVIGNDDTLSLGFERPSYTVQEDAGELDNLIFVVKEPAGVQTELDITVNLILLISSAEEGADFEVGNTPRILTFTPEQQRLAVPISVINDNIFEESEDFKFLLSTPAAPSYRIGSFPSATVSILDDDIAILGFEQSKYTVGEGDGSIEVCVRIFVPDRIEAAVIAAITTNSLTAVDADYTSLDALVILSDEPLRRCFDIPITDDDDVESIEQLNVELTPFDSLTTESVMLQPNVTVICIQDNDITLNIDECSLGTHDCDSNAQCMDTLEGFVCTCNPGYTGDGSSCTDINECARSTHNCHPQARCENTAGGFKCKCRYGYAGNGVSCSDVNECIRSTHNCHRNALCKNTNGGFECSCYEGYVGNGIHCTDVNECISYKNNCNRNARCVNTDGSFRCFCNLGFLGNGVTCTSGAAAVAVDLEEFTSSRTRSRSGTKSASNRSNSGTKSTKMRMG